MTVTDDKDQLQEWVESIKPWPSMPSGDSHNKEGGDEHDAEVDDSEDDLDEPPPMMRRESSFGLQTLKLLRQRLQNLE